MFLNRSYWPDGEATGQLLTELTEDLAARLEVTVVAGQPNTNPSGEPYITTGAEVRNGVRVLRVPHTRFPKGWLPGRAVNFVTFVLAAAIRSTVCRRQDVVVVETDPFLLALVGVVLRLRHRASLVVYLQDIHPDVGIAVGRLRETALTRVLRRLLAAAYRSADRVIVLSEDMRQTLRGWRIPDAKIIRVPNWVDADAVRPAAGPNRFRGRAGIPAEAFVVMYSGNLGMTQRLDVVLDAAERLRDHPEILFAFVGGGAAEAGLKAEALRRSLSNVRFFPYQPKAELGDSLSAADLHVISIDPAALPYLMPSKLYGILAAGRPVIATVPTGTELADEIVRHGVGFVVPPGDAEAFAAAVASASKDRDGLREYGTRARRLAEREYHRPVVTARFADLLATLTGRRVNRAASAA